MLLSSVAYGAKPKNEIPPGLTGVSVVGHTLAVSNGTWVNDPTSFTYTWQKCTLTGEGCSKIADTEDQYVLDSSDVGHTIRVKVKASNSSGSGTGTSAISPAVGATETEARPTGCFENPETEGVAHIEKCDYPTPRIVGAEAFGKKCSELESEAGEVDLNVTGERYEGKNLTGYIRVTAPDVTINDDCITDKILTAEDAVYAEPGVSGLTVENATIHGENHETGAIEVAINAIGSGNVASKDYMYNCGECIHGEWDVTKSYIFVNGFTPISTVRVPTTEEEVHLEGYYLYAGQTAVVKENTIFNPEDNALFFGDTFDSKTPEVCENHVTLENNFFAGAGIEIYLCAHAKTGAEGEGTSTTVVKGNRFARCLGSLYYESETGGTKCGTGETLPINGWPTVNPGADEHGYWPYAGYFGLVSFYPEPIHFKTEADHTWEGNFWDNDAESCPELEYGNCS